MVSLVAEFSRILSHLGKSSSDEINPSEQDNFAG